MEDLEALEDVSVDCPPSTPISKDQNEDVTVKAQEVPTLSGKVAGMEANADADDGTDKSQKSTVPSKLEDIIEEVENEDGDKDVNDGGADIVEDGPKNSSVQLQSEMILSISALENLRTTRTRNAFNFEAVKVETGQDQNTLNRAGSPNYSSVPCFGSLNINLLKVLNKFLANTALSLVLLGIDLPYTSIIAYYFVTREQCGTNPELQEMAKNSLSVAGLCVILMPILIKKKLIRLSE